MYCPNCNTEIDESDRFCQHCGQALSDAREESKEDSKATAILTAIRNLDGVDDKLLNRPEIGHLPSVLEDGELPDFIVTSSLGAGCLVTTNRRVIQVEISLSVPPFKSKSFAYGEILSFEPYSGVLGSGVGSGVRIHKSDGEAEIIVTERSRTRAFVDHVNAKIRAMGEMGEKQPEAESAEEQKTSGSQPEHSGKSEDASSPLSAPRTESLERRGDEPEENTKWETMYKHEYFGNTAQVSRKPLVGEEVVGPYNNKALENHLNKMFADGWEVISMEPDWHYGAIGVSMVHEIAKPLAIVGWYITFKRRQEN